MYLRTQDSPCTMRYQHRACLIKGGKISSLSNNSRRTYVSGQIYPSLHAEHLALLIQSKTRRLQKNQLKNYTLMVIRILPSGNLGNSRPCNDYIDLMRHVGISKVYYTNEKGELVKEKLANIEKLHFSDGGQWFQSAFPGRRDSTLL